MSEPSGLSDDLSQFPIDASRVIARLKQQVSELAAQSAQYQAAAQQLLEERNALVRAIQNENNAKAAQEQSDQVDEPPAVEPTKKAPAKKAAKRPAKKAPVKNAAAKKPAANLEAVSDLPLPQ